MLANPNEARRERARRASHRVLAFEALVEAGAAGVTIAYSAGFGAVKPALLSFLMSCPFLTGREPPSIAGPRDRSGAVSPPATANR